MRLRWFVLGCIISCTAICAQAQWETWDTHHLSKKASLAPLLEVLQKSGVSGSLEFTGSCSNGDYAHYPDFPKLREPATKGGSTLQTVREMFFADNPTVEVTQDKDGTIRMVQFGVATDILNVRIAHISFERDRPRPPIAIFEANEALRYVLGTPEVRSFKDALGSGRLGGLFTGNPYPVALPPGWPHIAGDVNNVTVAQALDYILKTFPGIWWYQNCPATDGQPRTVHFGFYRLQRVLGENFVR
jgi:hypothetical protein